MNKKVLATACAFLCAVSVAGQITLKGKVVNKDTGDPVEGVAVRIPGILGGVTTNTEGVFEVKNIKKEGEYVIRLSHINYLPLKSSFNTGDNNIVFKLEENYINCQQVVVTGTGTHHRMSKSPIPISVITARDIKNSSATSMEEVLTKLNPSFSFSTNGMGTTMTLNGVEQDYVLILVNGKKMTGDDTYKRININSVKRVEVLNGAASALYGSDAIGGVVNIITDEPKNKLDISSNTTVMTHGRITESVNAAVSKGNLSSYTSYRYEQSGSWQHNSLDTDSLITGKMTSVGYYSHNVDQKFVYDINPNLSVYVNGGYYEYSTDRPSDRMSQDKKKPDVFKPAYTYDLVHRDYRYGAGMKYIINKNAYVMADFYSDNGKYEKDYLGNDKHEAGERMLDKKNHYYNGNVKGIFKLGLRNKLSAGMEYVYEQLNSEKTTSAHAIDESMYTMSAFAQDEWKIIDGLSAVAGVRYIYHRNFKNYATPNVSLMYTLNGFNVRASYGRGFRTPSLAQMYTMSESRGNKITIPNSKLKPEKNDYYTLNVEYNSSRFSIRATAFYNELKDMINYRVLSDEEAAERGFGDYKTVQERANIDRARIKGFNIYADAYIGYGLSMGVGYTFNDAHNVTDDKPLDKSLKHAGVVNASWKHTWDFYELNVNLSGRAQGKRYSERYEEAPSFSLWDINTRHKFTMKDFILEPGIGVENVFDYRDDRLWNNNFATLTPGRSFFVSLNVRFTK